MITIKNLTFSYTGSPAIFADFDWQVERGETWAIIGPSGCGKSTLLYLLAGLRLPAQGNITINAEVISRPRPETGLILQDHGLLPWATVYDNVRLGLNIRAFYGPDGRHAPRKEQFKPHKANVQVEHWLQRLGIAAFAKAYPSQLSGGQRQRTAIARTLVLGPDLLLMDEPFSALDAPTREDLQNLTVELQQEAGLTSIIVTHNIEEAVFLGKRILALGHPPNKEAIVIENPDAGTLNYRSSAAYHALSVELRQTLGELA